MVTSLPFEVLIPDHFRPNHQERETAETDDQRRRQEGEGTELEMDRRQESGKAGQYQDQAGPNRQSVHLLNSLRALVAGRRRR